MTSNSWIYYTPTGISAPMCGVSDYGVEADPFDVDALDDGSSYDYAGQDPVNDYDLAGTCKTKGWVQVDPSGRCVSRAVYNRSFKLQGAALITFLEQHDGLNTYEAKIVFAESSGCTHASEGQCDGPSDAEYYGLGQLSKSLRARYLSGRTTTTSPWLQIWAMRQYIRERYGSAEEAWSEREKRSPPWY